MAVDYKRYHLLIEKLPVPYAYLQLAPVENPACCTLIDANPAFETMVGLDKDAILGQDISTLLPEFTGEHFGWLETYQSVTATAEPIQIERFNSKLNSWYEIGLFCCEPGFLDAFFMDVTAKKQSENLLRKSEQRFRSLVGNLKGGIVVEDENRTIMLTNQTFCDIFSIPAPPEALIGSDCSKSAEQSKHLMAEPELFPRRIAEIIEKQEVVIGEEIFFANGCVYERDYIPVFDEDYNFIGRMWQYQDITERKQAEEKLKKSEEKYREILATIEEGYYEVDLAGNFVFFNDSFCRTLGYDNKEITGQSYKNIYEDSGEVFAAFNRVYRTGEAENAFCWHVTTKDGREIIVELSIILRRDQKGNQIGFSGIAKDVTKRKQHEEKLKYLSLHDQLTGLYNRTFFVEEMHRLSKSRAYPITIISADINELKQINDLKGHAKGDEYLKNCAEVLSRSLRSSDILARIGGDEFVMLLPRTGRKAGDNILERIRNQVDEHNKKHPEEPLSLSMGLATAACNDVDLEEIYKQADRLMLKEKVAARGKSDW